MLKGQKNSLLSGRCRDGHRCGRFRLRCAKYECIVTARIVYIYFLDQFQPLNRHFCHTGARGCRRRRHCDNSVSNFLSTYFGSVWIFVCRKQKKKESETHWQIVSRVLIFQFFNGCVVFYYADR